MFRVVAALCITAGAILCPASAPAQESIKGERLDPSLYGPAAIEPMQAVVDRDRLAGPFTDPKQHRGQAGEWVVPSRRATTAPRSGAHNVVNKWGDPRMGIGFPTVVDVQGAYFSGQAGAGAWTTGLRAIGYLNDVVAQETDWFWDISDEPTWFPMDLRGVDRIEIIAVPVVNGAGWYAMDDLTYLVVADEKPGPPAPVVVDFDDLGFNMTLTGTNYAGLTWELGAGDFSGDEGIHGPQVPPGYPRLEATDGARAEASGSRAATPTIVAEFSAAVRGDAGSWSFPPDTMGAIGPDHFVVTVNRMFQVYEKDSGARIVNTGLGSFLPGSSGDPRVLYDQHSDRWVVVVTDFGSRLYLAVSLTDDPTGAWFKTSFVMSAGSDEGRWPDYPTLGVDAHGIYTAAYMVGGFGNMSIFAIDKAPLLEPTPALGTITAFRGLPWEGAIQPAHTFGEPVGQYFLSVDSSNKLRVRRVDPPMDSPTLHNLGTVNVPSFNTPPLAPALGSTTPLDTVGTRLMMALYRGGSLWTCHTINVDGRAGCRWYEINAASRALLQSGTVAEAGMHYFFPSIMVNQYGSAVMGFTGSNSSMYASCYFVGRLEGDPPGEMSPPVLYKAGTGPLNTIDGYGRNRFGDYSYTTLDPVDEATFWTIQEYGHGNDVWGTYVAALTLNDGDCNNNGIPDLCDIDCGPPGGFCDVAGCGQSPDCNNNGIPDECEVDCNGNGIPDDCDIASGFSPDCNNNGIPDECDIASGFSQDCQPNGIPDECDLAPPPDTPASDMCSGSDLACTGIRYFGSTVGATSDGSSSCDGLPGSPDVWYRYQPYGSGQLTISLCGSTFDTVLSLHTACPGTVEDQLACNDNYCGEASQLTRFVTHGTNYWIRIAGQDGATGDFELTLSGPSCTYSAGDADGDGIPDECQVACHGQLRGDANCDGAVNSFDIDPFVLALTDPDAWVALYPNCDLLCVCDANEDGAVNSFDIDPFVALLTGG
jgi:hypothetical protein